jgi:hypothetical protein
LNAVLTFKDFLTGATNFIAGWYLGASMNPTPTSFTHVATLCREKGTRHLYQ